VAKISLTSNGDGTGRLEVVIDRVRLMERRPGIYDLVSLSEHLPQRLRCGEELLQPKLIVKLFCKSGKQTRFLKLKQHVRLRKLERLHAG